MFCLKCGKEITDDSAFCNSCGAKIVYDDSLEQSQKDVQSHSINAKSNAVNPVMIIVSIIIAGIVLFGLYNIPKILEEIEREKTRESMRNFRNQQIMSQCADGWCYEQKVEGSFYCEWH